jgi:hypothetical protein
MKFLQSLMLVASLLFTTVASADTATLWVFGGRAVSNSITDVKSNAWGVYQETPTKFGRWDFGYLNEGHQGLDKRDGIYAMIDAQFALNSLLRTSFAIGPYFTATTVTATDGVSYKDTYRTDLLAKASIKYSVTNHWNVEASWWHALYSANDLRVHARGDADVFTAGVGYKF